MRISMKTERYIDKRTQTSNIYIYDKNHRNKSTLSSTFSFKCILDPISYHRSFSIPLTSAPHPHSQSPCSSTGSHFFYDTHSPYLLIHLLYCCQNSCWSFQWWCHSLTTKAHLPTCCSQIRSLALPRTLPYSSISGNAPFLNAMHSFPLISFSLCHYLYRQNPSQPWRRFKTL